MEVIDLDAMRARQQRATLFLAGIKLTNQRHGNSASALHSTTRSTPPPRDSEKQYKDKMPSLSANDIPKTQQQQPKVPNYDESDLLEIVVVNDSDVNIPNTHVRPSGSSSSSIPLLRTFEKASVASSFQIPTVRHASDPSNTARVSSPDSLITGISTAITTAAKASGDAIIRVRSTAERRRTDVSNEGSGPGGSLLNTAINPRKILSYVGPSKSGSGGAGSTSSHPGVSGGPSSASHTSNMDFTLYIRPEMDKRIVSPWNVFDPGFLVSKTPGGGSGSSIGGSGSNTGKRGSPSNYADDSYANANANGRRSVQIKGPSSSSKARTSSVYGLNYRYNNADGVLVKRRNGSKNSIATSGLMPQTIIQNLASSVGEIISSVFRGGVTGGGIGILGGGGLVRGGADAGSISGGPAGGAGGGDHSLDTAGMSPFETEMRNLRDSDRVLALVPANTFIHNASTSNSNSNMSFAFSASNRRPSMNNERPPFTIRKSEISLNAKGLLEGETGMELIPLRQLATIRSKNSLEPGNSSTLNHLLNAKITFVSPLLATPTSVFSVLSSFDVQPTEKKRKTWRSQPLFSLEMKARKVKIESYQKLLEPANTLSSTIPDDSYDPSDLDDPELKTGKHRTVIKLQSYVSSIILYSRPADIKKELNEVFREIHPDVDPELTLSQIRNLKGRMIEVGKIQNMELSSVACAMVFFEKLVFKNYANKANRRLIAGSCLLLAAKINDPKEFKYKELLEVMERVLEISAKDVFQQEFSVFAALEFNLFIPLWQILPHLDRILRVLGYKNIDEYLEGKTFFVGNS